MRGALFVAALIAGIVLSLLGDEPFWLLVVAAVVAFPPAVAAAGRGGGRVAVSLAALAGGFLAGLLARLAVAAPGWENAASADCGGASTGTQQLVLWTGVLVFALAAVPVVLAVVRVRSGSPAGTALTLYPLAVAASGLALIGASAVTSC